MPLGPLKRAVCYPLNEAETSDSEIVEVLERTGLGYVIGDLATIDAWESRLSGGEQQRLAFCRVLLIKPDWLFVDEATCSLDDAAEAHLYALLTESLPRVTLISIAHGKEVARFHSRFLHIGSDGVMTERNSVAQ